MNIESLSIFPKPLRTKKMDNSKVSIFSTLTNPTPKIKAAPQNGDGQFILLQAHVGVVETHEQQQQNQHLENNRDIFVRQFLIQSGPNISAGH